MSIVCVGTANFEVGRRRLFSMARSRHSWRDSSSAGGGAGLETALGPGAFVAAGAMAPAPARSSRASRGQAVRARRLRLVFIA
jgi:hypothetical protein